MAWPMRSSTEGLGPWIRSSYCTRRPPCHTDRNHGVQLAGRCQYPPLLPALRPQSTSTWQPDSDQSLFVFGLFHAKSGLSLWQPVVQFPLGSARKGKDMDSSACRAKVTAEMEHPCRPSGLLQEHLAQSMLSRSATTCTTWTWYSDNSYICAISAVDVTAHSRHHA